MTTIVYKKGKWIAADKRAVGGESWYRDETFKIFTLVWDNFKLYLWFSWRTQIKEIVDSILAKHFAKEFDASKLLDLRDDLSKASFGNSFGTILVYQKLHWDDATETLLKEHVYRAFHIDDAGISEVYADFAAVWSWSVWVDWILTAIPDMEPAKLFELVSSKDLNTSTDFDLINLSI